jgi:hypothetical protein
MPAGWSDVNTFTRGFKIGFDDWDDKDPWITPIPNELPYWNLGILGANFAAWQRLSRFP